MARYDADEATIRSMVEYVHQQKAATGLAPDERTLLLEPGEVEQVADEVAEPFLLS